MVTKYFPAGIATESDFCNRGKERKYIKECINNNEHLVLVSPRRYGKTSLIAQVILDNKLNSSSTDLLLASDPEYIKNAILSGVGELSVQLLPKKQSLQQKFLSFFAEFNPKLTLTALGQQLELSSISRSPKTITSALLSLNEAAKDSKKHVVFVLDEFQQIASIKDNHMIEASIRHAVERSSNVTYIFSGSNRKLLEQMFNDKSRPLYHLCELMRLDRIQENEFKNFIKAKSKDRWSEELSESAVDRIVELTECHTFYVNRLCRLVWKSQKLPIVKYIYDTWKEYVFSQNWIIKDLANLSPNQKKLITTLAYQPVSEIYGQTIRKETELSQSSITRVVESLEKLDMIYQDKIGEYRVLDPAIRYFIQQKSYIN